MEARYASYRDLADLIRQSFVEPRQELHQLYARLVFNVLIGNVDDHACNHSAFWSGHDLSLTPGFMIFVHRCVQQAARFAGVMLEYLISLLDECSVDAVDYPAGELDGECACYTHGK